jgi:hypothetical protein
MNVPDSRRREHEVTELLWYAELREAHRPERIRVLLVGESAPDPGDSERRFFYAPLLDRRDNLYRGVVGRVPGGMAALATVTRDGRLQLPRDLTAPSHRAKVGRRGRRPADSP